MSIPHRSLSAFAAFFGVLLISPDAFAQGMETNSFFWFLILGGALLFTLAIAFILGAIVKYALGPWGPRGIWRKILIGVIFLWIGKIETEMSMAHLSHRSFWAGMSFWDLVNPFTLFPFNFEVWLLALFIFIVASVVRGVKWLKARSKPKV